jgi:hypothetical protein
VAAGDVGGGLAVGGFGVAVGAVFEEELGHLDVAAAGGAVHGRVVEPPSRRRRMVT